MKDARKKHCLGCHAEYALGEYSCPACGNEGYYVATEIDPISLSGNASDREDTRTIDAPVAADDWDQLIIDVVRINRYGAMASIPAFICMAAMPLPFGLLAGAVALPVAVVNLAGVFLALHSGIQSGRYKRSGKLLAISLTPGIVFLVCAFIARQQ